MRPRVRFAPSPTGELHVGGARTALFNWLFARKHGGTFLLRFEDTDVERNRPELVEPILESLRWLGIEPDEGPYFQSERLDLYREYAERLLTEGQAYRCYCTPEELEVKRTEALAARRKPLYDGRCRHLSEGERRRFAAEGRPHALRIKTPLSGITPVHDRIRGEVRFDNADIDDFVIVRSDGRPTYNFAVVVDDIDMRISHVIRADEHLNNTPKQIMIYSALGVPLPEFAHVPMVLAKDRSKLSKRHGATAVMEFKERGILPEALVNHLARLGWSYGDQEVFSREELIEKFSLEGVNPSAAVFDEEKLLWLNHHHIMHGDPAHIGRLTRDYAITHGIFTSKEAEALSEERWTAAVLFLKERKRTLSELAEGAVPFLTDRLEYDPAAADRHLTREKADVLERLTARLREISGDEFGATALEEHIRSWLSEEGLKLGALAQPCRVALTGVDKGPGLFETIEFLGKDRVIRRLEEATKMARQGTSGPI